MLSIQSSRQIQTQNAIHSTLTAKQATYIDSDMNHVFKDPKFWTQCVDFLKRMNTPESKNKGPEKQGFFEPHRLQMKTIFENYDQLLNTFVENQPIETSNHCSQSLKFKIIGAGISGCLLAIQLKKEFPNCTITIDESRSKEDAAIRFQTLSFRKTDEFKTFIDGTNNLYQKLLDKGAWEQSSNGHTEDHDRIRAPILIFQNAFIEYLQEQYNIPVNFNQKTDLNNLEPNPSDTFTFICTGSGTYPKSASHITIPSATQHLAHIWDFTPCEEKDLKTTNTEEGPFGVMQGGGPLTNFDTFFEGTKKMSQKKHINATNNQGPTYGMSNPEEVTRRLEETQTTLITSKLPYVQIKTRALPVSGSKTNANVVKVMNSQLQKDQINANVVKVMNSQLQKDLNNGLFWYVFKIIPEMDANPIQDDNVILFGDACNARHPLDGNGTMGILESFPKISTYLKRYVQINAMQNSESKDILSKLNKEWYQAYHLFRHGFRLFGSIDRYCSETH